MAEQLLREQPGLSGIVVHNEPITQPLISAFQAMGLRVPEDLSVAAICPDETAEQASVPITSVSIPSAEIGTRAVDLLLAKLAGRDDVPETTVLSALLTPRATTAPPAAVAP